MELRSQKTGARSPLGSNFIQNFKLAADTAQEPENPFNLQGIAASISQIQDKGNDAVSNHPKPLPVSWQ